MSWPERFLDGQVTLYGGGCIEMMKALPDCLVDSVVTDPPYHLQSVTKRFGRPGAAPAKHGTDGAFARAAAGFMGKQWDGVEFPSLESGLGHWLAGFADGEGCFTARKSGEGYVCEFVIHIRADDSAILREIHRATEVGDLDGPRSRGDGAAPMIKWIVRRQADCMKLVQIFRAFPLRAKKKRDFEIWASAVSEWVAHEPGTSWNDIASHAEMLSAVKQYGKSLDASQFFHYRWAREAFRVLKPGGHMVAFGGTRTFHRLAAGIEDAGFEIRDQIGWAYGSGFPKSLDLSKAIDKAAAREWDGWGTALKPAWESICLARKPLSEKTIAANVLRWGAGALNIGACRIGKDGGSRCGNGGPSSGIYGDGLNGWWGERVPGLGRWPANLCHDGSEEVLACFPQADGGRPVPAETKSKPYGDIFGARDRQPFNGYSDSGSAARFFYTAKADSTDRLGSKHPTVKPLDLIQWLVRLVTPPEGICLDPFAGTGTLGEAAFREGFRAILIEFEEEYVADIRRRMALVLAPGRERVTETIKTRGKVAEAGPLFDQGAAAE